MAKNSTWEKRPANKITRAEYARDDDWIREFLSSHAVGRVATFRGEQPFITPVVYWYDPDAQEIYFHTNIAGRLRANSEQNDKVCFEVSRFGKFLPSNIALEFSLQYESVIVFGRIQIIDDERKQRQALDGLIGKIFPEMQPGQHYRPITGQELRRTSVFAICIDSWSGKRNWCEKADQSPEWRPLQDEGGKFWQER